MKIIKMSIILVIFLFSEISSILAYAQIHSARPWMGIAIEKNDGGVLIKKTLKGTPAEKAGLESGDIIISLNGQVIKSVQELIDYVGKRGVGNDVKVIFLRGKEKKSINLKLVPRPDTLALLNDNLLNKQAPSFLVKNFKTSNEQNFLEINSDNLKKPKDEKVKIVEFWATWCPACVAGLSEINKKLPSLQKAGVELILVSSEKEEALKKFFDKKIPPYEVFQDVKEVGSKKYMVTALPTFFVIDKKGVIRHISIGVGDYLNKSLDKAIQLALEK